MSVLVNGTANGHPEDGAGCSSAREVFIDAAVRLAQGRDEDSDIRLVPYCGEEQIGAIMSLISRDLSEPYSIYTYRYFLHNWSGLCFLAQRASDGEFVGAVVCKLDVARGETRRGYIAMLAVDGSCRRRRVGSRLVRRAMEAMRVSGCDEVVLETEVTNAASLRLYERLGFVRDKRLFRYYLNGVDAFRLKLWLSPPLLPFQLPFFQR